MSRRMFAIPIALLIVSLACSSTTPTAPSVETPLPTADQPPVERDAFRLVVDGNADLGSAQSIADFVAVQGAPWSRTDPFEAQAWKDLQLRAGDTAVLLNDEFYFNEGGLEVIRSTTPPTECASGARGPLGPQSDLWLCADLLESFLQDWSATLGTDFAQYLNLSVMPRTLSYNPDSPNWAWMSPANPEEWSAVMREAGRYLAEHGWNEPTIWFFGEYENNFRGKDHPLDDGTAANSQARAEDYAELYILTQNALQESLPQVKLIGATSGTYSRDFTRDLQQNPYALGVEDWLEALQRLDPSFVPTAVGWQGYYWYGLDGYGAGRLLEGADHIRGVLRNMGYPEDIPQYLGGWNGTFGNFESADGTLTDDARLQKEAAHLASTVIDMLEIGSERRRIQSALYYTWNLDGPFFPDYHCEYPYQSLVSTIHEGMTIGEELYGSDCNIPPSTIECKRAPYYALDFLNDFRDGNFIASSFAGEADTDTSALRVASAKKDGVTSILLAHRDGDSIPFFHLEALGFSPNRAYIVSVQTIRSTENTCAEMDSQTYSLNTDANGALFMPLPTFEGSVVQIIIQPQ